ncbi:MAG: hypothetical protein ACRDGN_18310 [bacterium]
MLLHRAHHLDVAARISFHQTLRLGVMLALLLKFLLARSLKKRLLRAQLLELAQGLRNPLTPLRRRRRDLVGVLVPHRR